MKAREDSNFIIIFADDQGYGDIGCDGGDLVDTPRLTMGNVFQNVGKWAISSCRI